jgi:hypothetical protein
VTAGGVAVSKIIVGIAVTVFAFLRHCGLPNFSVLAMPASIFRALGRPIKPVERLIDPRASLDTNRLQAKSRFFGDSPGRDIFRSCQGDQVVYG